jgi:UDP-glucose 4-epimerase
LGEDHDPETHLIPNVVRYALGLNPELVIFGNDYPTPDGTCIRDYIHVMDLADAHIKALKKLDKESAIRLNLGTGKGISNLEIIQAVEERLSEKIKYKVGPRRPGDPPELVADASAAAQMLEWTPKRSGISTIVGEVLDWYNTCPNGYGK